MLRFVSSVDRNFDVRRPINVSAAGWDLDDWGALIELPRVIHTYWHQGFDVAPLVVRRCADEIVAAHPDCEVRLLSQKDVDKVIDEIPLAQDTWDSLGLAFKSDLIRTALLIRYGGIWMDPTVFPVTNVHAWLQKRMDAGVFAFSRPGRDRIMSNWLIASYPDHPLLTTLLERLCHYWCDPWLEDRSGRQSQPARFVARLLHRNLTLPRLWLTTPAVRALRHPPYLVYHYMVYDVLQRYPQLATLWHRMPHVSADAPHRLQRIGLHEPLTELARTHVDQPETPVFKLTWKLPEPQIPNGSVLEYLFSRRLSSRG